MSDTAIKYHRIEGTIEDGELHIEYVPIEGRLQRMLHDEDVSNFTTMDCKRVIRDLLDLNEAEFAMVTVYHA